jgi:hypothetical protein
MLFVEMSGHHKKTIKKGKNEGKKKPNVFARLAENIRAALNNLNKAKKPNKSNKAKKPNYMGMGKMLSVINEVNEEMKNEEFARAAENMEKEMKKEMLNRKTRNRNTRIIAEALRKSARTSVKTPRFSNYMATRKRKPGNK